MKKSTVAGTGILLVILLALVTIAYNLEPSQEVKRVGWVLNFQWNRVVATTGNAEAQRKLGYAYATGEGVNKDYAKAVKWFRRGAEKGDARSQFDIGLSYYYGYGVKQSYSESFMWYKLAATKGYARAYYAIGELYANGEGVKQDKVKAKEYYGKACDNGFQDGCDEYRKLNDAGY